MWRPFQSGATFEMVASNVQSNSLSSQQEDHSSCFKPGNILLSVTKDVKITDFNISKIQGKA